MSLYAEYISREEGRSTIENEHCFITYKVFEKEMYVFDFYASPTSPGRERYKVWDALLERAHILGADCITCVVWVDPEKADYTTRKFKVFMGHGFKVIRADKNTVVLKREVVNGVDDSISNNSGGSMDGR